MNGEPGLVPGTGWALYVQVPVFPPLISTTYVGAVWSRAERGLERQEIGFSGGLSPAYLSSHPPSLILFVLCLKLPLTSWAGPGPCPLALPG